MDNFAQRRLKIHTWTKKKILGLNEWKDPIDEYPTYLNIETLDKFLGVEIELKNPSWLRGEINYLFLSVTNDF